MINLGKSQHKHPWFLLWNSSLRSPIQLVVKTNYKLVTEASLLPTVWNTAHMDHQCFQRPWSILLESNKDSWNHSKIEALQHNLYFKKSTQTTQILAAWMSLARWWFDRLCQWCKILAYLESTTSSLNMAYAQSVGTFPKSMNLDLIPFQRTDLQCSLSCGISIC